MIVKEKIVPARSAREFEVKREEKTVGQGQGESRIEEKWQTCWCCQDQRKTCRMAKASAKKLEQTGLAEKQRVTSTPQTEQLTRTSEPPLLRRKTRKEPSVQIKRSQDGTESRGAKAAS